MRKAVRIACLGLLAALIITPLLQIVMRGVFNIPMAGAEELARYFLICLSFIGASYVTREGGQIRMEEFQALIPPMPRWILQMTIELAAVVLFTVLFVASVVTISNNMRNQTPTLEMPFWLFMAPLAVGSLLLVVESIAMLAHTAQRGRPESKQTVLT
jgi:TRAP-type C4-dicarboxylate transport system permease small subunit